MCLCVKTKDICMAVAHCLGRPYHDRFIHVSTGLYSLDDDLAYYPSFSQTCQI